MPALLNKIRQVKRRFVGRGDIHQTPQLADALVTSQDYETIERVKPYTLTGEARIASLVQAIRYIHKCNIPGAIVECGVWRGGSMMAAAYTLRNLGNCERELYLFDTFEGMPPPSSKDIEWTGNSAEQLLLNTPKGTGVWCYASQTEVAQNMTLTGYPESKVHLVRGSVEDTLPQTDIGPIALLRLDTDWYESTKCELLHLYPQLSVGGVLIIDDYGHWRGSRQAVDEYFSKWGVTPVLLQPIDYSGRVAVKCFPS